MEPETQRQIDDSREKFRPRPQQPPIKKAHPRVQSDPFSTKSLAQKVCLSLGVIICIYGMAGFAMPNLWGAHLGTYQNVLHIAIGLISIWYGAGRSVSSAKLCCGVFGSILAAVGIVGLLVAGGRADSLWVVIPNSFQMGTTDHLVHIAMGAIFLLGSFFTLRNNEIVYH